MTTTRLSHFLPSPANAPMKPSYSLLSHDHTFKHQGFLSFQAYLLVPSCGNTIPNTITNTITKAVNTSFHFAILTLQNLESLYGFAPSMVKGVFERFRALIRSLGSPHPRPHETNSLLNQHQRHVNLLSSGKVFGANERRGETVQERMF